MTAKQKIKFLSLEQSKGQALLLGGKIEVEPEDVIPRFKRYIVLDFYRQRRRLQGKRFAAHEVEKEFRSMPLDMQRDTVEDSLTAYCIKNHKEEGDTCRACRKE